MSVARNILRQARSSGLRRQSTNAAASSSSSGWTRPVPEGVIPAYDEALKFLSRHSETTLKRANELEQQAKQARGEEANELLQAARRLRVEARIDDPATLWAFENGNASSSGADADVLRSLSERRWRQEGGLDLLVSSLDVEKLGASRESAGWLTAPFSSRTDGASHANERYPRRHASS